jgi:heme O synthase-like polyprenyltransferase
MRASAMKAGHHVKNANREMMAVVQGQTRTHTHLRRRLLTIFLATAVIAVICTLIVYFTESGAKGTEIHNLFDAFLFSTSQLLTASSVAVPKTNFGKVLELFFDIWAITVVATVAGSFGAFFHARSKEMDGEMDRVERQLEHEVEALREKL